MELTAFNGITAVAGITAICYLIGMIASESPLNNRFIPSLCGIFGALLGLAAMYVMPHFPAEDHITAAAVGIVSGLAATGADQCIRQLGKGK